MSLVEDWLVGFYGISTFVGYLMPNSVCINVEEYKILKALLFQMLYNSKAPLV